MTAEGNIHLGPEDLLEGRLTFKGDVVVEGRVEGELRLTGRLSLRDGGAVVGDVRVARLQVEEGAVLHGNVRVGSNGAAEAAPAAERPPVVERAPVVEAVPEPEPEPTPEPTAEPEPEPVVAATAVEVAVEAPALVTEVAPAAVAVMEPEPAVAATSEDGFTQLFDGVSKTGWRLAGAGDFKVVDGTLEAAPDASGELGLLWHSEPTPRDFVLKLEWKLGQANDGSGIYLRFPDPGSKGYLNQAWVAVDFGIEVQVDEYGWPDRAGKHRTGAFYDQDGQTLSQRPGKPPGEWNDFEIRARGQEYTVLLNGEQVSRFRNKDRERAVASTAEAPTFIGLQINPPNQGQKQATGRVAFRNIRIKPL